MPRKLNLAIKSLYSIFYGDLSAINCKIIAIFDIKWVTQPVISNRWELVFEVTGWQRPIITNLRGGCRKGSIFDNHPQNDHVYLNIHMYIRIYINSIF